MAVIATCTCGKSFNAKAELAGKRVKCPACGQPLLVPAVQSDAASQGGAGAASIAVTCQCGRSFKAPAHLAGKRVACPACQSPLSIPQPPPPVSNSPGLDDPLGAAIDDPLGSLGDFSNDPFMGGVASPASHASPTYASPGTGRSRKAKKKSTSHSKIILYIVCGIGGVIFLGCAGLFIVGFVGGVRQGISEARGAWKVHASVSGGFAAMMPGRVKTDKFDQEFGNFTAPAEEVVAVVGNGDEIYISVYRHSTFASPKLPTWAQKASDASRPEMPDATISNVTVAGQSAVRMVGVMKIGARTTHKIEWFMCAGDRLYVISILSGDKPADPQTISKFIDSFRLIGVPSIRPASAIFSP